MSNLYLAVVWWHLLRMTISSPSSLILLAAAARAEHASYSTSTVTADSWLVGQSNAEFLVLIPTAQHHSFPPDPSRTPTTESSTKLDRQTDSSMKIFFLRSVIQDLDRRGLPTVGWKIHCTHHIRSQPKKLKIKMAAAARQTIISSTNKYSHPYRTSFISSHHDP